MKHINAITLKPEFPEDGPREKQFWFLYGVGMLVVLTAVLFFVAGSSSK